MSDSKKYEEWFLTKELEKITEEKKDNIPPVILRSSLLVEMEEEKDYLLSDTISHETEEKEEQASEE